MEIIDERYNIPENMQETLRKDIAPEKEGWYRYKRGAQELYEAIKVKFDLFEYLGQLVQNNPDRQVSLLESGCGYGHLGRDLRQGFTFDSTDFLHTTSPDGIIAWKKSLSGREYPGFGNRIKIVGATLSINHAEYIQKRLANNLQPDQIVVGSIAEHDFGSFQFDVLIDHYGPATHHPSEKLFQSYADILRRDGLCLIKTSFISERNKEHYEHYLHQSGLYLVNPDAFDKTTMLLKTSSLSLGVLANTPPR